MCCSRPLKCTCSAAALGDYPVWRTQQLGSALHSAVAHLKVKCGKVLTSPLSRHHGHRRRRPSLNLSLLLIYIMDGSFSLQDRVNTQPRALENTTRAWRQTTPTRVGRDDPAGQPEAAFLCSFSRFLCSRESKCVTLKATFHRTDTPELIASGGVLRTEHWCLSCIHPKMNFAGSPFNPNKLGLAANLPGLLLTAV